MSDIASGATQSIAFHSNFDARIDSLIEASDVTTYKD